LKEIFLDNIVLKEYDVSLSHNLNILNLDNIYFNKIKKDYDNNNVLYEPKISLHENLSNI